MIGKMKDKLRRKIVTEFVGLKSKVCSLVMAYSREIKKPKGVKKNIVESIRHQEYPDLLFGRGLVRRKMKMIQSKLHRIGTCDVCKRVLVISVIFLIMLLVV